MARSRPGSTRPRACPSSPHRTLDGGEAAARSRPHRAPTLGRGMSEDTAPPILEVRGVTKTFPGVIANQDVNLTLHRGKVLCLLGENGAGKSTIVNVIFGLYQPDSGEVWLDGEHVDFKSSRDAIAAGIGMV